MNVPAPPVAQNKYNTPALRLSPLDRALWRRPIHSSCVPKSNAAPTTPRARVRQRCHCVGRPLPLKHCVDAKPQTQMADRRATVANPFADIIQTAQKAPRPEAPLRPANAARKAVKKATKTPVRSPIRRRDDKDADQLRKEVARLKRENFSLAARLNARAAAPQPAQDEEAPPPPPPAPRTGRRYSVSTTRFSLDSRLPAARRASFALVQPTSKPPPLIEEATPSLEFVAVYGAFDAKGEGAAGSSSIKGRTRLDHASCLGGAIWP